MSGYIVGGDRVSGVSPFGFGDDRMVGVATVAQTGGELANGATALLHAKNRYAAAALLRQLVEVEYLAHAFEKQHVAAGDWLRAGRDERKTFWSPAKLRERAGETFLRSDYWRHCDMGGHPTTDGRALLPDHPGLSAHHLWADLAGHLVPIWRHVVAATEQLLDAPIPAEWDLPADVPEAIQVWREADGFSAAMRDLSIILSDES
jgi:hypothetical protein